MTPPSLRDPIPFVFNTVQFVFNNDKFMKRATYVVTLVRLCYGYLFHLTNPVGTQTGARECPHRKILAGHETRLYPRRVEELPNHLLIA
jgi:hypothetical protein